MKTKINTYIALLTLAILCGACKNKAVDYTSFEIAEEQVQPESNSVAITGTYSYTGEVNCMKIIIGLDDKLSDAIPYPMNLEGCDFSISIDSLRPNTKYYYCYSIDFGLKNDVLLEVRSFTTLHGAPEVETVEVTRLDSTSYYVKGRVVSDNGSPITERGICWNTSGNPNPLTDEIIIYGENGVGEYKCLLSQLALNTKYYVRAYAKNEKGMGYGEVIEFETASQLGPFEVLLRCNPEEGGATNGAGIYEAGSQCTVTATANAGYNFVNWTENGEQVSTDAIYSFVVTTSHSLAANFSTKDYVITVEIDPENGGDVTGTGAYNEGDECVLNAIPKPDYDFVGWSKGNITVSTDEEYSFTVTETATYMAHFQKKSFTIEASTNPDDGGIVLGDGVYQQGESCTVTAMANTGYTFLRWTENGSQVSTNASYTFIVTSNRILVAQFQAITYTITVSANPNNGGEVTGGGSYNYDNFCTVRATATNGFVFTNWTENEIVISEQNEYTFTVTGNRTLVANFTFSGEIHEYVDLGLPSGTLWATCNIGADTPEDYGDYFAWGETSTKNLYKWSTYRYCNGSATTLTKYCDNASYGNNGFTDNLTVLEESDDAANVNWGTNWRMPTKEEWGELLNNTTNSWTTQNGVHGYLFTASNGRTLFLPAAGYRNENNLINDGSFGYYWSSSLNTGVPYNSWYEYFDSNNCYKDTDYRCYGRSVRPVRSALKK